MPKPPASHNVIVYPYVLDWQLQLEIMRLLCSLITGPHWIMAHSRTASEGRKCPLSRSAVQTGRATDVHCVERDHSKPRWKLDCMWRLRMRSLNLPLEVAIRRQRQS
jgi:hypothetical protein